MTLTIIEWQKIIRKWAISKGFKWKKTDIDTILLRLHSEISEASEAIRDNNIILFKEECADIFIRLVDMCEVMEFDLEEWVNIKHNININRQYLHGRSNK